MNQHPASSWPDFTRSGRRRSASCFFASSLLFLIDFFEDQLILVVPPQCTILSSKSLRGLTLLRNSSTKNFLPCLVADNNSCFACSCCIMITTQYGNRSVTEVRKQRTRTSWPSSCVASVVVVVVAEADKNDRSSRGESHWNGATKNALRRHETR